MQKSNREAVVSVRHEEGTAQIKKGKGTETGGVLDMARDTVTVVQGLEVVDIEYLQP